MKTPLENPLFQGKPDKINTPAWVQYYQQLEDYADSIGVFIKTTLVGTLAAMGFDFNASANGYMKFPLGFIVQWGTTAAISVSSSVTITFPIQFPTGVFSILSSPVIFANNSAAFSVGASAISTTQMKVYNNSATSGSVIATWFAIGH